MKQVHIYYHGDLDGIFSAILYGKLFTDNGANKLRFNFTSVNYHLKDWQTTVLPKAADTHIAVVDFLYNPTADVWYDHHQGGLGVHTLDQVTTLGAYNDTAPSCAQVIYNQEGRDNYKDETLVKKVVEDVNMVDYAMYPTIEHVYNSISWSPMLRMALLEQGNDEFFNEIIRMGIFDRTFFYKLLDGKLPWSAEWRYVKYKHALEIGYEKFKKVAQIKENVVHYTDPPYVKTDRYFAYKFEPSADFTVYVKDFTWRGHGAHVGVSKNPWKPKKNINLKELAETYGGGGHQDVAGITCTSLEEAEGIKTKILEELIRVP